jgi:hypothetical protein
MIDKVINAVVGEDNRDLAYAGAGMAALVLGRKAAAAALFSKGIVGLEKRWRRNHPDFSGGLRERWAMSEKFYEETHQDETNRLLHVVGIPMIVGGTAGLVVFPSYSLPWAASAGLFGTGWALNFVGHGVFEKSAPALKDDPLSFIAGPVWDVKQVAKKLGGGKSRTAVSRDKHGTLRGAAVPAT